MRWQMQRLITVKFLSARVPREDHFGGGASYAKATPHYFQEHIIIVVTQLPLRSTLRSVDYVRRIAKRSVVLGASDVRCVPRVLVKGLTLTGLVVRSAKSPSEKEAEGQTRIF